MSWIRATQRLPETSDPVIVTLRLPGCGHGNDRRPYLVVDKLLWRYMWNPNTGAREWKCKHSKFNKSWVVIAWQPLPEPYEEETK